MPSLYILSQSNELHLKESSQPKQVNNKFWQRLTSLYSETVSTNICFVTKELIPHTFHCFGQGKDECAIFPKKQEEEEQFLMLFFCLIHKDKLFRITNWCFKNRLSK